MEYKVALCDDDKIISSKIMETFNNELHVHNLEATIDYYSSGNVLIEAAKDFSWRFPAVCIQRCKGIQYSDSLLTCSSLL